MKEHPPLRGCFSIIEWVQGKHQFDLVPPYFVLWI